MITGSRSCLDEANAQAPTRGVRHKAALTPVSAGPDRRIRQLAPRGAAGNKWSGQQASNYWSSSSLAGNPNNAWNVNFNNGNVNNNNKTNDNYARAVRSGR